MEIKKNEDLNLSLHFAWNEQKYYIRGSLEPALLLYALWAAFNLATAPLKTIAIHSSAIIYHGKAILYLGESGTGKSTHARLIHQHFPDVELLNDDSPIIRIEGDKCMVYGSPWSGKTSCYKQKKVELGGVVRLQQSSCNQIKQLDTDKALAALLPSFPPELYLSEGYQYHVINILSDMLERTEVFLLECLPNKEAAELSVNTVIRQTNG